MKAAKAFEYIFMCLIEKCYVNSKFLQQSIKTIPVSSAMNTIIKIYAIKG